MMGPFADMFSSAQIVADHPSAVVAVARHGVLTLTAALLALSNAGHTACVPFEVGAVGACVPGSPEVQQSSVILPGFTADFK
jgi:hypothetical protein